MMAMVDTSLYYKENNMRNLNVSPANKVAVDELAKSLGYIVNEDDMEYIIDAYDGFDKGEYRTEVLNILIEEYGHPKKPSYTESLIESKTVYTTTDGKEYDTLKEAVEHQKELTSSIKEVVSDVDKFLDHIGVSDDIITYSEVKEIAQVLSLCQNATGNTLLMGLDTILEGLGANIPVEYSNILAEGIWYMPSKGVFHNKKKISGDTLYLSADSKRR